MSDKDATVAKREDVSMTVFGQNMLQVFCGFGEWCFNLKGAGGNT